MNRKVLYSHCTAFDAELIWNISRLPTNVGIIRILHTDKWHKGVASTQIPTRLRFTLVIMTAAVLTMAQ